jgi:cytochrome c553
MPDPVHPIDRRTTAYRPWGLYVTTAAVALCVAGLLIGAVILPLAAAPGGEPLNPLAAICRSLGITVAAAPARETQRLPQTPASRVAWTPSVSDALQGANRADGEFIALNCGICHDGGAQLAPHLRVLQPEYIWKQLHDYRDGRRKFPAMNGIARALDDRAIVDVAAHYGAGSSAPTSPERTGASLAAPDLVVRGDVQRGIPPCQACHDPNQTDRRVTMAPRLEGQKADYLARQLGLFQTEWRDNDSYRPMREVARRMTATEIDSVAQWYAAQ